MLEQIGTQMQIRATFLMKYRETHVIRTRNFSDVIVGRDDPRQSKESPRRIVGVNGEEDAELARHRAHLVEEEPQVVPDQTSSF